MLNAIDLAVIRAALQFFDEEFSPSDEELLQHYLDHDGVLAGVKVADIKTTRTKLDHAKVYLGLKRAGESVLISTEIFPMDADVAYQVDEAVPVSIVDVSG